MVLLRFQNRHYGVYTPKKHTNVRVSVNLVHIQMIDHTHVCIQM